MAVYFNPEYIFDTHFSHLYCLYFLNHFIIIIDFICQFKVNLKYLYSIIINYLNLKSLRNLTTLIIDC